MIEVAPQQENNDAEHAGMALPHVYLVAGGGGGMRSTIILRLLAQELSAREITYSSIDGIYIDENGTQAVRHPSLQEEDLAFQMQNVQDVVDAGLRCVSERSAVSLAP